MSDSHEVIKPLSDGNANGSDGSQDDSPLSSLGLSSIVHGDGAEMRHNRG